MVQYIDVNRVVKGSFKKKRLMSRIVIVLSGLLFPINLSAQTQQNLEQYSTIILFILLIPILFILPSIFCVKRAKKLKRNKIVWGILGFVFSYITVVVMSSLKTAKNKT